MGFVSAQLHQCMHDYDILLSLSREGVIRRQISIRTYEELIALFMDTYSSQKKRRYLDLELPYFALQQEEHRSLASWQTLTRRHMRQPGTGSTYSHAHTSEYSTKLQTYLPVWHHQRARIRVCKLPKSAVINGKPLKFQTTHRQIDRSMCFR